MTLDFSNLLFMLVYEVSAQKALCHLKIKQSEKEQRQIEACMSVSGHTDEPWTETFVEIELDGQLAFFLRPKFWLLL